MFRSKIFLTCILCLIFTSLDGQKNPKIKKASRQDFDNPVLSNEEIDTNVAPISTELDIINLDDPNPVNVDDNNALNKYCKCSETICNCCREFPLPLIPTKGPGCAKIQYLGEEKMSVTIKYGDVVLASRTVSGKKAPPVCMGLPGGFTKFCGRVYGLSKGKDGFKACLGLELRADSSVEAALRLSCFNFGAKGFSVTEAEPLPPIEHEKDEDESDDFLGLEDDDEEDDDDDGGDDDVLGDEGDEGEDYDDGEDNSTQDYDGFSLLDTLFSSGNKKKKPSGVADITFSTPNVTNKKNKILI